MTIGWHFDNTYSKLPNVFLSEISPIPVKSPDLLILNDNLSKELELNFSKTNKENLSQLFSGNLLPENSKAIAQAYAGHQFGHFTMLGDGRATLIGEHLTKNNYRFDIQFKGSGKTPFSRNGDGRAALGPMLREYIISEAMHSLRIPTTRSLAVVKTGENVLRETPLQGAILTRVASSHLRVGTFQYIAARQEKENLITLVDYTIDRHYPNIKESKNKALDLLKALMEKQIKLVINWMRVGFIHGVMNTDNMAISGETIDYGPCAFMDTYDPQTVFSSIDQLGRYAYFNQPSITKWNLARFAECLIPLIDENKDKAIKIATETINSFEKIYEIKWLNMMRDKLGLFGEEPKDQVLILDLLKVLMEKQINLVINWMRVGFIHGVMNTDNMTISGETIDYGPCAFMDTYDPQTVFSSIDQLGRYAYFNQPSITKWNLARFAECLIPLINEDKDKAIKIVTEEINNFEKIYEIKWLNMMRDKLGLFGEDSKDQVLILDLLTWMHQNKADYTNTFCYLMNAKIQNNKIFNNENFIVWKKRWEERLRLNNNTPEKYLKLMKSVNPLIIPRNHKVEEALEFANNNDLSLVKKLIKILEKPYENQKGIDEYQSTAPISDQKYQTFCGT